MSIGTQMEFADIDKALEEEFGVKDDVETVPEKPEITEPTDDNQAQVDLESDENADIVEDQPETPQEKPTKDEQKDYAFAEYRKENAQLKQNLKALETIAKDKGYESVDDFLNDLNAAQDTLEAQEKNIEPSVYREFMEIKRRNQELERQINEQAFESQVYRLREALDKHITDLDLGTSEEGTQFIMGRLAEYGYTADEILQAKNPEVIIKGVLVDKIQEKALQVQLAKQEKLDQLADEKHTGTLKPSKINLDDEIAKEMKAYAEENFL